MSAPGRRGLGPWWLVLGLLASGCGPDPEPVEALDPGLALVEAARAELVGRGVPPKSGRAPLQAARAHLGAGRSAQARTLVLGELEGPAASEAHYLLGILESRELRWELAVPAFEQAFAPGPGYPEQVLLPFKYGRALEEVGRLEAARAAYQLDHDLSGDGEALLRLALLDVEDGLLEDASERLEQAGRRLTSARGRAQIHSARADVALARDDRAGARRELEASVAAQPLRETLARLARVCRELGDPEAAALAERALADLP